MWFRISALVVAGMLTSGADAFAQPSQLRIMAAPHANIGSLRSFHVLPTPLRADRAQRRGNYDPMAVHSRATRALWDAVQRELVDRGYVDSEWLPDFVVAIYASVDEQLDLDAWLYGYTHAPRWWSLGRNEDAPTLFPAGAVLVDVVDPETLDVLWRGAGLATISADPLENARDVLAVATTIIQRFPRAQPAGIATIEAPSVVFKTANALNLASHEPREVAPISLASSNASSASDSATELQKSRYSRRASTLGRR